MTAAFKQLLEAPETFEKDEILSSLINFDEAYYNDEPLISDAEYDELRAFAEQSWPNDSYFLQTGSAVRGTKVKHPNPVGGLNQVNADGLTRWLESKKAAEYVVSEKLDGSSVTLSYVNGKLRIALTRGDGIYGSDCTRHVLSMRDVPINIGSVVEAPSFEVRGEIIIKKEHEQIVKELLLKANGREYKNLRAIANGLINAKDIPSAVFPYLRFVAYGLSLPQYDYSAQLNILDSYGFKIPRNSVLTQLNESLLTKTLIEWRETSKYEIDGVVVQINNAGIRNALDIKDKRPQFAFKWKVADENNEAVTTVTGIEWKASQYSYLIPTVLLEPVELCGATIKRAAGFNAAYIKNNGVGVGAKVRITRSGDVIPYILNVEESVEPLLPDVPFHWSKTGIDAIANDESEATKLLKIKRFFNKLEIDQMQDATIKTLVENEIDSISKIIMLSREDWYKYIGRNGEKAYDSLHRKLEYIYMWELMGAFPSFGRGFGDRRAKLLCDVFGDGVLDVTLTDIMTVNGFSEITAQIYLDGLEDFIPFLEWCIEKRFVTIKADIKKNVTNGKLSGKKFVFTGFRSNELKEQIESLGGEVQDGIKKDTTHLVAKDASKTTSGKFKKAIEQGIVVIGREFLIEMLSA
ncbi:MAG: BRCT domain-containing protein [Candidatus Nitrosotenuis sp.]